MPASDLPPTSLQIKQDDKFYSMLCSKDTSITNPSFRVYYSVESGSVPFLWESCPGTPKNTPRDTPLPPLTPPPSYHHSGNRGSSSGGRRRSSLFSSRSSGLLASMLSKRLSFGRKTHFRGSRGECLSSSSSSSSQSPTDEKEELVGGSAKGTLCWKSMT